MSLVNRASDASPDATTAQLMTQTTGLLAGEDLDRCAACYIAADGLVYQSNGSAANAAAVFDGMTPREVKAGQPVTLYGPGVRFHYADSGLTPGQRFFVAATAGRLDDAATTGGTVAIAKAITPTDIQIL